MSAPNSRPLFRRGGGGGLVVFVPGTVWGGVVKVARYRPSALVIVAVVWVVPRGGPIAVKTRSYGVLALPEACLEICLEAWSLCFFACGVRWVTFPCFVILDFGSVLSVGSHGWRQSVDTKVGRSLISNSTGYVKFYETIFPYKMSNDNTEFSKSSKNINNDISTLIFFDNFESEATAKTPPSPNDDEEGPSGRDGNVHQPVPDSENQPGHGDQHFATPIDDENPSEAMVAHT
ncbi:hypothetical protein Tco_0682441 [Tanacetum coccineum]|uniref:Uncharacterized protein n=1 Tax=Tanacetum coccineum TaxID=301880 RepID=A0ABQ4XSP7_9ASTR